MTMGYEDDIKLWSPFVGSPESLLKCSHRVRLDIQPIKVYALFQSAFGIYPNGPYTFLQGELLPLDSLIWWDFAISSGKNLIHIWRTNSLLEASFEMKSDDFDLSRFLKTNISKYGREVGRTIRSFEYHDLFINHFKCYEQTIEFLSSELEAISVVKPKPMGHIASEKQIAKFKSELESFTKSAIRHHTVARALILNSAFCVEGLVHVLLTIARTNADDLSFAEKLKQLHVLTPFLIAPINFSDPVVQGALRLIDVRHKYVHSVITDQRSKVGTICFDRAFPLHPLQKDSFMVSEIQKTFLVPSRETALHEYQVARSFMERIEELLKPSLKPIVLLALNQNPLGLNRGTNLVSTVSPATVPHSIAVTGKKKQRKFR